MRFANRQEAGRKLATLLALRTWNDPVIVALPRGGVPVGFEVACALHAPLDVCIVRKLGAPRQPELGLGAIAEGDRMDVNRELLARLGVSDAALAVVVEREKKELERRIALYRKRNPRQSLHGRSVIVVDDGIATGGTMRSAILSVRAEEPRLLVMAVPVAAADTLEQLSALTDDTIAVIATHHLWAVGAWYDDFAQTTDDDVVQLLTQAREQTPERDTARTWDHHELRAP